MWERFIANESLEQARRVPFLQMLRNDFGPGLFTDAASAVSLGFGSSFEEHWGFSRWPLSFFWQKKPSIALLEFLAVAIAVDMLKSNMAGHQIRSDNMAMICTINNAMAKCKHCLLLVHHITSICLHFQIHLVAVHIIGSTNSNANALSHLALGRFNRLRQSYFNAMSHRLSHTPVQLNSPLWPVAWNILKKL